LLAGADPLPAEGAPSSHQKPLMPKGRIGFWWTYGEDYQWSIFQDGRCQVMGSSRSWQDTRAALKSCHPFIENSRPEDHYRKPESEQTAPVLTRKERMDAARKAVHGPSTLPPSPSDGAQSITLGYLSEDNDYWDKGNYWSGKTFEAELDAILAPLKMEQRIAVLESVWGAVHPEKIRETDREVQIARRDNLSQVLFIAGILCLVAMIPVGAVTMSLFAILGCAIGWLISWGLSFAVDPYS
jgi:hypothetical protein